MNSLSFREKSVLGTLVATVVVAVAYFSHVVPMLLDEAPLLDFLWPAVAAIVATIVVHIVYHILLGCTDAEEPPDERDRFVDLTATRWAYVVLCAGCVLFVCGVLNLAIFDLPLTSALVVHAIALVMTLADVTKYVGQLVGYRTFT